MAVHDIAEYIGFVIGCVADAVVISIFPVIIAPIIAMPLFRKGIRTFPSLRCFKGRLPDLGGIADKSIANEDILFGTVAEIEPDVVGGEHISFEPILVSLLDEKTSVLTGDEVAPNPGIIELFKHHSMPAVGGDNVAFDQRLAAEH